MATAGIVDAVINPNNSAQRYLLWGNGRIDALGGAVPITGNATWYDRVDQPVAVAIHIVNWATGAGYTFTANGSAHTFNGSTAIPNGVPNGVTYFSGEKRYIDWSWDPSGSGQGYALDVYGKLWPFGGATAPTVVTGARWTWPAAKKLVMQWTPSKRAIILDAYGGLQREFATPTIAAPGMYSRGNDIARDVAVTDWTTPAGYELDKYGGVHEFGGAPAITGTPYRSGADVARKLEVLSASNPTTVWEVWSAGQQWEVTASTPPTVNAGGGTSEVQRVAITGTPTGGTFTLTYSGQTTAAIAFNATAATVQTALRALTNIGATGVNVTGGPGPGTAWVVTFAGNLAYTDVPQMTATSSLTGGTSPTVTVSMTTVGETASPAKTVTTTTRPVLSWTYSDPQSDAQSEYRVMVFTETFAAANSMTDPTKWATSALVDVSGIEPTTRGVTSTVDLPNASYRLYVRAKDSAGQWSAWSVWTWTQNVPLPATPTGLTATPNNNTWSVALSVTATTGGSANLVRFECSDNGGTTWAAVRGAAAVTLAATTTATDWDVPLGVARQYRAIAYAIDPRVASAASTVASATVTNRTYVLRALNNTALGGRVLVQGPVSWTREFTAGAFAGLGSPYLTVVEDSGGPKGRRGSLRAVSLDAATWAMLTALLEAGGILTYRDPRGELIYCKPVGGWGQSMLGAPTEYTDETDVELVEVKPPQEV